MNALDTFSPLKMGLNALGITKPSKGAPAPGLLGTIFSKG